MKDGSFRLNRHKKSDLHYGQEVDVWAVGCMVYDLCVGNTPFDGFTEDNEMISEKQLCVNILKAPISFKHPYFGWKGGKNNPDSEPDSVQDFIEQCLVRDPKKRAKPR